MISPNKSRRSSTAVPESGSNSGNDTANRPTPVPPPPVQSQQSTEPENDDDNNGNGSSSNRKSVNFLGSLYTPTYTYKNLKQTEADNVLFQEDLVKFRKAQAAQRSLQWQFDELTRLFSRLESSNNQMITDYTSLMKEKDTCKRHMKTMNKEIDRYHFNCLDAEDNLIKVENANQTNVLAFEEDKLKIAKERDEWQKKYDDAIRDMDAQRQEYEEKLKKASQDHNNVIQTQESKEKDITNTLTETQANLEKCENELLNERKSLRNTRNELNERIKYTEEITKNAEMLNTKLTEAQHTINELRPWEVRYHGLFDRSSKQESALLSDNEKLVNDNNKLKALLKRMVLVFVMQGVRYRMHICQGLTKLSALNINISSQLQKINNAVPPNNMEDFDHAVQHQLEKQRIEITNKMHALKRVSVMSLIEDVESEISRTTEPVEALVKKVWVLHHTCNSLQQNSIQKVCDYMDTIEKHEALQKEHKHALEEWKRCDTLYKREQSDKTNLMSRVAILEREIAQNNKNRRYAQGIEALMKEHTKYQNLQEQIALMRRRIDLLKNEKKDEQEKLSQYTAANGNDMSYEEPADSQYNMSKPVVLPPFSQTRQRKEQSQRVTTTPHAKYGVKAQTKTQQQIHARQQKLRTTHEQSPRKTNSKLPITEAKMNQVQSVYDQ